MKKRFLTIFAVVIGLLILFGGVYLYFISEPTQSCEINKEVLKNATISLGNLESSARGGIGGLEKIVFVDGVNYQNSNNPRIEKIENKIRDDLVLLNDFDGDGLDDAYFVLETTYVSNSKEESFTNHYLYFTSSNECGDIKRTLPKPLTYDNVNDAVSYKVKNILISNVEKADVEITDGLNPVPLIKYCSTYNINSDDKYSSEVYGQGIHDRGVRCSSLDALVWFN